MYWAEALANQSEDMEFAEKFKPLFQTMSENEARIVEELNSAQCRPVNIEGYYAPNDEIASAEMRPSMTFNNAISAL